LKADKRLKYKDVRRVMQLVNEAGYSGVGLITTRKE
jgi:biopolymer transport protein ExbD